MTKNLQSHFTGSEIEEVNCKLQRNSPILCDNSHKIRSRIRCNCAECFIPKTCSLSALRCVHEDDTTDTWCSLLAKI